LIALLSTAGAVLAWYQSITIGHSMPSVSSCTPSTSAQSLEIRLSREYLLPSDLAPIDGVLDVGNRFAYISLADHYKALSHLVERLAPESQQAKDALVLQLAPAYQEFIEGTIRAIRAAFDATPLSRPLCIVNLELPALVDGISAKTKGQFVISLDSLDRGERAKIAVSRVFSADGTKQLDFAARPGSSSISQQLSGVVNAALESSPVVIDDFIFSSTTALNVLRFLDDGGLKVTRMVTFAQCSPASALKEAGIEVDPVIRVQYDGELGDHVELVEYGEFLIGSGGCIVQFPDGSIGRAPYILPFACPTKRASIPQDKAIQFSRELLELNRGFYRQMETLIGKPILVNELDTTMCRTLRFYGFEETDTMQEVFESCLARLPEMRDKSSQAGAIQSALGIGPFSRKSVLIDVNGTLVSKGEKDVNPLCRADLRELVRALQAQGVDVGLCSDSPAEPLKALARKWDMHGLVVAENGNLISRAHSETCWYQVCSLNGIEEIKAIIAEIASELGFARDPDRLAVEFSQTRPALNPQGFSFGAQRQTSISVFGPPKLIAALASNPRLLQATAQFNEQQGFSIDSNTDIGNYQGFLAIHPGQDFRSRKAATLKLLGSFGGEILQIGDSVSDLVIPQTGLAVRSAFVEQRKLSEDITRNAVFCSPSRSTAGLIDILQKVLQQVRDTGSLFSAQG
jgi:hydroxymethylpyrimidine pyrophosphatase-like HAD family hydrolase